MIVYAVVAAAAILAAVGLGVWVGRGGGGGSGSEKPPVALSLTGLATLARVLSQPIYWVGPEADRRYEVTEGDEGQVNLRYLPPGVPAGDERELRSVATYALEDAYTRTVEASSDDGSVPIDAGKGAVAYYREDTPTAAYIAFLGVDYQVEVVDPTPGVAAKLVREGMVAAVSPNEPFAARAVSAPELRAESARLGQPIYWVGPKPGATYELTETPARRVFVRYLPGPAAVGARESFRTVSTSALSRAFGKTLALGKGASMETIVLKRGGIGIYDRTKPTGAVLVAFAGSDYRIEVFDPIPGKAVELVRADRIVPVG